MTDKLERKLDMVQKMLFALLKSQGHVHVVGGYAWGYTSNDDPFIVLYPEADYLKHKSCRVYPQDFAKLPPEIVATKPDTGPDDPGDKDRAQKKGIYHECAKMLVVTYDGKETQMGPEKRFSDVLWVAQPDRRPQTADGGRQTAERKAQTAAPADAPAAEQHEEALDLARSVYGAAWQERLAELCRLYSEHKVSALDGLNRVQVGALKVGLLLRRDFHELGKSMYGERWPDICLRNCQRIATEFVDHDTELTDDQVGKLLAGMQTLRAKQPA